MIQNVSWLQTKKNKVNRIFLSCLKHSSFSFTYLPWLPISITCLFTLFWGYPLVVTLLLLSFLQTCYLIVPSSVQHTWIIHLGPTWSFIHDNIWWSALQLALLITITIKYFLWWACLILTESVQCLSLDFECFLGLFVYGELFEWQVAYCTFINSLLPASWIFMPLHAGPSHTNSCQ